MAKLLADIQASTKQSGSVAPLSNPLVQQYTWSMPTQSFNPVADLPPRLRAHAEASADRVDELPPHQLDARHDQQRAAAVPGLRDDGQPAVHALDDVGVAAVDVHQQSRERVPHRRHGRRDAVLARARTLHVERRRRRRQSGGLPPGPRWDHGRNLLRHGIRADESGPWQRPTVARSVDQGHRGHGDLAQGQAQRDLRRLDGAGRRVAAESDAGADGQFRADRERSGELDVLRGEFPGRVQRPISRTRRACTRCSPAASRRFKATRRSIRRATRMCRSVFPGRKAACGSSTSSPPIRGESPRTSR